MRIEDDAEVRNLRDGAAGCLCEQTAAAPAAQQCVDLVAVQQRRAAAAPRREALRGHLEDGIEIRRVTARGTASAPRRASIQCRLRDTRAHAVSATICCARTSSGASCVTMASSSPRRTARSSAAHSIRSSRDVGKDAALRQSVDRVPGTADALQERRDAVWRPNLADEVDVPDVDAELERGRGHERAQLTGLQARTRRRAASPSTGCRDAPSTASSPSRSLRCRAEPLRHAPRIDEDQRRPMRLDQRREPVVIFVPDFVRHHRFERGARGSRSPRSMSRRCPVVDNGAWRLARRSPTRISRDLVDRLLRRRQSDAKERLLRNAAARRSSDSARCAPRRVPMTAWISSTMTVRTVRSMLRGYGRTSAVGRATRE